MGCSKWYGTGHIKRWQWRSEALEASEAPAGRSDEQVGRRGANGLSCTVFLGTVPGLSRGLYLWAPPRLGRTPRTACFCLPCYFPTTFPDGGAQRWCWGHANGSAEPSPAPCTCISHRQLLAPCNKQFNRWKSECRLEMWCHWEN